MPNVIPYALFPPEFETGQPGPPPFFFLTLMDFIKHETLHVASASLFKPPF